MRRDSPVPLPLKEGWTPEPPAAPDGERPVHAQRHYSVAEVAQTWNLSPDLVRRLFEREPGVLVIGDAQGRPGKRRYVTLRIPECVLQRVHRKLSRV
jgi:AraC-like DNA-binding protein